MPPAPDRAPPDGRWRWAAEPGWVLLPLRLFLGITFLYAGFSKLFDPAFFDGGDPASIEQQMRSLREISPLGPLLEFTADHAGLFGYTICLGELIVGLGVLLGLFTRLHASGGALLSLSFLLTVSWQTQPYYYGSDIVFLAAWVPLVIAGSGGVLSVDAWLAARQHGLPSDDERRAALVGTGLGLAGLVAALAFGSRAASTASTASTATGPDGTAGGGPGTSGASAAPGQPASPPAGGTPPQQGPRVRPEPLVALSQVPAGGARRVTLPADGRPAWVMRPDGQTVTCLSAVCPHAGCTVAFVSMAAGFACPCHGSRFTAGGAVMRGPAREPLRTIAVSVQGDAVLLD